MNELHVPSRDIKHRQGIYDGDAKMRAKREKAKREALEFWARMMVAAAVGAFIVYQFAISLGWV